MGFMAETQMSSKDMETITQAEKSVRSGHALDFGWASGHDVLFSLQKRETVQFTTLRF